MKEKAQKVTPLLFDSYMAMVENAEGSKMFRSAYAEIDGVKTDITRDGGLSCAFFVSSILVILKLIKKMHVTVGGTVKDLIDSGWTEIEKPVRGSIIVWKNHDFGDGEPHPHIGFSLGGDEVVSNSKDGKYPIKHKIDHRGREIEKILWNTKLD